MLRGQNVSDFACVLGETFHLGPVGSVVESQVALGVSDEHPLLEEIEIKGRYFIWRDIHVYLFDVSIEGAPYFDFVAGGREEAQGFFDIPAADDGVLVSSYRVVDPVVVVEPDGLARKDQPQHLLGGFVDGDEAADSVATVQLSVAALGLDSKGRNDVEAAGVCDFDDAFRVHGDELVAGLDHP